MCANWSAPFNYVWYKLPDLKNKFEFSDFYDWWSDGHGAGGGGGCGGDSGELLMSDW